MNKKINVDLHVLLATAVVGNHLLGPSSISSDLGYIIRCNHIRLGASCFLLGGRETRKRAEGDE